ncbi:MAG: hypothetical protein IPJ36_05590 [Simplicispira sp.]|nr:hypothetical protein [Simplicispira sp.]
MSLPLLYRRASDKALAASAVSEALSIYYTDPALAPAACVSVRRMQLLSGDNAAANDVGAASLPWTLRQTTLPFCADLLEAKVTGADDLVQKHFPPKPPQLQMTYARCCSNFSAIPWHWPGWSQ